jgi:hypothetical protein
MAILELEKASPYSILKNKKMSQESRMIPKAQADIPRYKALVYFPPNDLFLLLRSSSTVPLAPCYADTTSELTYRVSWQSEGLCVSLVVSA